ncbi:hypothetical protein QBC43DRAFT_315695 [Cladorrhinum sp. PSN259]|nr:hypothetical protein QBC43DRAFT_315695 [Cladorrhinum sp. PSN259]
MEHTRPGPTESFLPNPSRSFDQLPVETLECLLYSGGQQQKQARSHRGTIQDVEDIPKWLAADPPPPEPEHHHHHHHPSGGGGGGDGANRNGNGNGNGKCHAMLRLVCVEKEYGKPLHPFFEEPTKSRVDAVLGLTSDIYWEERGDDLLWRGVGGCGRYTVSDDTVVYIFHRTSASNTFGLVLSWDEHRKITRGYLAHSETVSKEVPQIVRDIEELFVRFGGHALAVAVAGVMFTVRVATGRINGVHNKLAKIEIATGFSPWASKGGGHGRRDDGENKEGGGGGEKGEGEGEGEGEDFSSLARHLGHLNADFGFVDFAVRSTTLRLEFILREWDRAAEDIVEEEAWKLTKKRARERMELLKSRLEHMPLHCAVKDRLNAQQTVLFNLISQQDSSLNIGIASDSKELAAASKRDSSSMKIIAVLTTLFLPGTFISTLFSMPLFDWEVSRLSDVSARYIWLYWVITIALTVVVMGLFGAYAWYQGRENERSTKQARESIFSRVMNGEK